LIEELHVTESEAELKGVKGWLLLLCLLLTVFDPSVVLVSLFVVSDGAMASHNLHPEVFRLILVNGILRIGLAVFSIYAGLSLWKLAPKAVITARSYLVAIAVSSVFLLFLPLLLGVSEDAQGGIAQEGILNTLLTVLYVAVWYAYLARSRRVRATYLKAGGN
jgi:hypothetical protein